MILHNSISRSLRGTLIECFFSHTCRLFSARYNTRVHANSCRFTSAFIPIFLSIVAHVRCTSASIRVRIYIIWGVRESSNGLSTSDINRVENVSVTQKADKGTRPIFRTMRALFIRSNLKANITLSMLYRFDESMPRQRHADNNLRGVGRFIRMHTQPLESIATRKLYFDRLHLHIFGSSIHLRKKPHWELLR